MKHNRYFVTICLFFVLLSSISGQVVLQLEKFNSPIVEKIFVGQTLHYKSLQLPDVWQKQTIIEIKDKEQLIVFLDGMVALKDIIALRKPKAINKYLSNALYLFGVNWIIWGTVAVVKGDYELGWDTPIIGLTAILAGWIFRKFRYSKLTMNKTNRLRIIDISWPHPSEVPQNSILQMP